MGNARRHGSAEDSQLRHGRYVPAFLEPRRAAEKALAVVVQQPAGAYGYSGAALDIDAAGEPVAVWSYYDSQGIGLPPVFHALAQIDPGP